MPAKRSFLDISISINIYYSINTLIAWPDRMKDNNNRRSVSSSWSLEAEGHTSPPAGEIFINSELGHTSHVRQLWHHQTHSPSTQRINDDYSSVWKWQINAYMSFHGLDTFSPLLFANTGTLWNSFGCVPRKYPPLQTIRRSMKDAGTMQKMLKQQVKLFEAQQWATSTTDTNPICNRCKCCVLLRFDESVAAASDSSYRRPLQHSPCQTCAAFQQRCESARNCMRTALLRQQQKSACYSLLGLGNLLQRNIRYVRWNRFNHDSFVPRTRDLWLITKRIASQLVCHTHTM